MLMCSSDGPDIHSGGPGSFQASRKRIDRRAGGNYVVNDCDVAT